MKNYTLAYSPCPNDTFIFAALTNGLLADAPHVDVALDDVEALNMAAMDGKFALTKISYGAIPLLVDKYRILRAGGALGRGCGPLVIAKPKADGTAPTFEELGPDAVYAIPGIHTTAFCMLRLAMGRTPKTKVIRFDEIVNAVANGEVDAGLIIHESRFTYQETGLKQIVDLGDWWEHNTGHPIPLGAILVRRDISDDDANEINASIRRSLAFAYADEPKIIDYVREHAFEMSDDVMHAHIDLYVNEYSDDVGASGIEAVNDFFARITAAGFVPPGTAPEFV